eukprot:scaffold39504_cov87-Phaeocystis_antarctica.AAC.1
MDLVFDGLLDRAAEAEGCAGASLRRTQGLCGRPEPHQAAELAEAGRSSGQPEACSGAERGLRSASWPKG